MTESKIPHFHPKICIQGNYTPKWGHSAMSSTDQPGLRAAQQKPFEESLFAHFCVNRDNSGHPGADGPKPKVKIETSIFNQCPGFCLIVFCLHGIASECVSEWTTGNFQSCPGSGGSFCCLFEGCDWRLSVTTCDPTSEGPRSEGPESWTSSRSLVGAFTPLPLL